MGDAPHRMAAFARQVQAQRPARVGRERHALRHQPFHRLRAALGDEARGVLVDQAGAGVLGVAHVRIDAVVVAEHADDAALRPGGGAFVELALGQHHHRAVLRHVQRHGQAGQAGADDDDGRGPGVLGSWNSCDGCAVKRSPF